jgi:hypothetical protein
MNGNLYVLGGIIIIICFIINYRKSKVNIKSSIDGRFYNVKNNAVAQESANLLALMNRNIMALILHIKTNYPEVKYYKNLYKYNPDNIHENILNFDTTYTVDKGKMILFCNGPRDGKGSKLYDINTMMYVAVHELSHVVSNSIGHTIEFKLNFADLLKKAIEIGVYEYIDYSKSPIDYCGIPLSKNILG